MMNCSLQVIAGTIVRRGPEIECVIAYSGYLGESAKQPFSMYNTQKLPMTQTEKMNERLRLSCDDHKHA